MACKDKLIAINKQEWMDRLCAEFDRMRQFIMQQHPGKTGLSIANAR